jgi:hypothetical protein
VTTDVNIAIDKVNMVVVATRESSFCGSEIRIAADAKEACGRIAVSLSFRLRRRGASRQGLRLDSLEPLFEEVFLHLVDNPIRDLTLTASS